HDTATLSQASSTAGGTVTYSQFDNGTCAGTATTTQTVTVTNAVVPDSSTFTPSAVGSYSYRAQYSGDTTTLIHLPATSACEPFRGRKAPGPTTTQAAAETPPSFHDTATVTAAPFTPTGTLTYNRFASGDCTGAAATTQTVTLTTGGAVPNSASTGTLAP